MNSDWHQVGRCHNGERGLPASQAQCSAKLERGAGRHNQPVRQPPLATKPGRLKAIDKKPDKHKVADATGKGRAAGELFGNRHRLANAVFWHCNPPKKCKQKVNPPTSQLFASINSLFNRNGELMGFSPIMPTLALLPRPPRPWTAAPELIAAMLALSVVNLVLAIAPIMRGLP